MGIVLIKFSANYHNECIISGFAVRDQSEWDAHIKQIEEEMVWPQSKYFGIHDGFEWCEFNEFERCFEIIPISNDQFLVLQELYGVDGKIEYGHFLDFDRIYLTADPMYK